VIERHASIDSTQARALALAAEGAPDGTRVVARTQTAGTGRYGHAWASPEGGLWLSWIAPRRPAPSGPGLAPSIVAALAARAAIAKVADLVVALKWPNDLFAGRRKLGGVIATERAGRLVFGIGIDANVRRSAFPLELRATATSILEETGRETDLARLEEELVRELERRLSPEGDGGRGQADEAWRCLVKRHRVRWRPPGDAAPIEGEARGLDASGALLLHDGARERIVHAGDLEILWPNESA